MTSSEVALSSRETRISVESASPGCGCTMPCAQRRDSDSAEPEMELPYPEYEPRALWMLDQTTRPRSWCLVLISWPYPFSVHLRSYGTSIRVTINTATAITGTKLSASQNAWGPFGHDTRGSSLCCKFVKKK